jgi:hypothetical protein
MSDTMYWEGGGGGNARKCGFADLSDADLKQISTKCYTGSANCIMIRKSESRLIKWRKEAPDEKENAQEYCKGKE